MRDNLLRAIKSNDDNPLTAKDLGYKTADRVFVNELLSYDVRQLFYKVWLFKKEHDYKFAWTRNQNVYVKKSSDSKAVKISSAEDLAKLD